MAQQHRSGNPNHNYSTSLKVGRNCKSQVPFFGSRIYFGAVLLLIIILSISGPHPARADGEIGPPVPGVPTPGESPSETSQYRFYFPAIMSFVPPPILLGTYPQKWPSNNQIVYDQLKALDIWAGKNHSIAGTFEDLMADPKVHIEYLLNMYADNGYTPYLNLGTQANSGISAYDIASGKVDPNLRAVARSFKNFTKDGTRMAFIAFLNEMNGSHVSYGLDPANFKTAFRRIQQIFTEEGVPRNTVRWVFAPNGSSPAGKPGFEDYYPGDQYVDAIATSAYHYGYCPAGDPSWLSWQTPERVIGQYVNRLYNMAPSKPIFISQTATSSWRTPSGRDHAAKDQWLLDAYRYVETLPNVRGVIYFNWDLDCDWFLYKKDGEKYDNYKTAVASKRFGWVPPEQLMKDPLTP